MRNILLEIKRLACELFALSMIINEKTEYNCFCSFHGHVKLLQINTYYKEDSNYKNILDYSVYLDKLHQYLPNEDIKIPTMEYLVQIQKELLRILIPNTEDILENAKKILYNEESNINH